MKNSHKEWIKEWGHASRCGSVTISEACKHFTNYTSAHESRSGFLGTERFAYPDHHIEADNRLGWLLGRLEEAYGDNAFYCHLTRDEFKVAESFVKRYDRGIIKAYRHPGILMSLPKSADPLEVCLDYCRTINSNIHAFLKDKTHKMDFRLENYENDFPLFCDRIGAEGDLEKALQEFTIKHNAS